MYTCTSTKKLVHYLQQSHDTLKMSVTRRVLADTILVFVEDVTTDYHYYKRQITPIFFASS